MSKKQLSQEIPQPAAGAVELEAQAGPDDSAQFRAGILQRYNAPFPCAATHDQLSQ
jgi:hypothetical protein